MHVPKFAPLRNAMCFSAITGGSLVTDACHTTPRKVMQRGKQRSSLERLSVTALGYRHEDGAISNHGLAPTEIEKTKRLKLFERLHR